MNLNLRSYLALLPRKTSNCYEVVIKSHIILIMLHEGLRLSSSPGLHGRGAGQDVISFEAWLRMRFMPKQVVRCEPSM